MKEKIKPSQYISFIIALIIFFLCLLQSFNNIFIKLIIIGLIILLFFVSNKVYKDYTKKNTSDKVDTILKIKGKFAYIIMLFISILILRYIDSHNIQNTIFNFPYIILLILIFIGIRKENKSQNKF